MNIFIQIASATKQKFFSALFYIRTKSYSDFVRFGKRIGWWKLSLLAGVVGGIAITLFFRGLPESSEPVKSTPRLVSVRTVAELSGEAAPLSVVGTVESKSEAKVLTESSGQITRVNASLGSFVSAGQVIAEMQNSRERAAVLQAQGSVDAAEAALAKVKRGTRDEQVSILGTNLTSAQSNLATAKEAAVTTLQSVFTTIDDVIHRKTDGMFSGADTNVPRFSIPTTETQLATGAENTRVTINTLLKRQSAAGLTLSPSSDLSLEISRAEAELKVIRTYLDTLSTVLSKAIATNGVTESQIASYKTDVSAARSSISTSISSLNASRETLTSRTAAVEVAKQSQGQGTTVDQNDIAAAEAALKIAEGSLAGARSNLERTVIRAPIAGTINSLPLTRGDFVAAFTPAVTIANNKALEVTAYVTENESPTIAVGSAVAIEDGVVGIVTRVAPVVDPMTKKIEVRIGVSDSKSLSNGAAVTVTFSRTAKSSETTQSKQMVVPISALKIGSNTMVVFTVNEESKLVAHPVIIGTLLGEKVVITSGIRSEDAIVTDARGLKEGDQVTLQ